MFNAVKFLLTLIKIILLFKKKLVFPLVSSIFPFPYLSTFTIIYLCTVEKKKNMHVWFAWDK